jgi:type VI secretion system protein ImpD
MTAEAALDLGTLEVAGTGRETGPARSGPERGPSRFGPPLATLEEFLGEDDWGRALVCWFGGRPAGDRDAVLNALDRAIAEIDALLTAQVNAVIHHPRFQKLEASWRGVRYLVAVADEVENVVIRVLQASWHELCRDLERAIEFDQSQTFQKIYNEEFGMPGGQPYGLLVGDYEVQHRITPDRRTDDVAGLKAMSAVSAAAFAPFIVGISPAMLGLDSFRDLTLPIDLPGTFRMPEYLRWKTLQETEDARFVGLALPRILMRRPYGDDGSRIDGFRFEEDTDRTDERGHLWASAGYAFASAVVRAFGRSGWFTDIRGARRDTDGGGLVVDLPVPSFETDRAGIAMKYSTEVALSERQEKELSDLGFIPLSKAKDTPYSVFYSNQSAQAHKRYDTAAATVNARISSMLQYILCVARFAHYLKVLARDKVGSFQTPEECEQFLRRWLQGYCNANDKAGPETLARYPLREGSVQVREPPGRPGIYQCTIHLRPHFQLDQVLSEFKLVTELAPPAG